MPFVPDGPRFLLKGEQDAPDPQPLGVSDVLPAAFRTENIIGSAMAHPFTSGAAIDPTFNPFDHVEGYEDNADAFINANTVDDVDRIKQAIDRERKDREILAASGAGGFAAAMAASLLDPTVFLPVGGTLKKGESILRLTARTMAAGGFATAAQEIGLQATQELRSPLESAVNISGATLLSGVLGAGFGALAKGERARLAKASENSLLHPGVGLDPADPFQSIPVGKAALKNSSSAASLSAASRDGLAEVLDDLNANQVYLSDWASKLAARTGSKTLTRAAEILDHATTKAAALADPVYSLLTNPVNTARNLVQELADVPVMLEKNRARMEKVELPDGTVEERLVFGRPTTQSAESVITRKIEKFTGRANVGVENIYLRYLNGREKRLGDRFGAGVNAVLGRTPADKLKPRDFEREVWKALSRNDEHAIPEVAEAAKFLRENFFKPLEDEAVELGMFGLERQPSPFPGEPDVYVPKRPSVDGTAESYRPRVYSIRKIKRNRDDFINRIFNFYKQERDVAAARAADLDRQIANLQFNEIGGARAQMQTLIRARTKALRDAREKLKAARDRVAKAKATQREADKQLGAAQTRTEKLTEIRELSDEQLAYYKGLAREVTRGYGEDRPTTIIDWVRAQGGFNKAIRGFEGASLFGGQSRSAETVLDYLGNDEVTTLGRRRLLNDGGKSPNYMREAAVEAGWLREEDTVDDLMDLVRRELNGERIIHDEDLDLVAHEEYLAGIREEAERADVDYSDPIVLGSWMEGEEFTQLTRFQKGKLHEANLRERYALRRFQNADEKVGSLEDALHEARVYSRTIRELAPEMTAVAKDWRKVMRSKMREKRALEREFGKLTRRGEVSDDDLLQNARRTTQRIEGTPVGALSYDFTEAASGLSKKAKGRADGLASPFHGRRLLIPDHVIEDFLEDDLEATIRMTARSMIPDIELTRRFGSVDLELQLKGMADSYEQVIAEIDPAGAPKELKIRDGETPEAFAARQEKEIADARAKAGKTKEALTKHRDQAMKNVAGIRDRLRGRYGLPEDPSALGYRAINFVKTLNHIRLMGGVTLASLPDFPRVVFTHGFSNFAGVAMESLVTGLKGVKLAGKELEEAGIAFELVNDTRTMAIADIIDDYGRLSAAERAIGAAKANFGQLSLMAPWNHAMKSMTGLVTQNRILSAASALLDGKIKLADADFLARIGIGEEDAREIGRLWREVGQDGRIKSANTQAWGDQRLADVFHDAMRKEIDRVIVTPGQEKPLFASGPIGSLIFQFGSYNFAATQRVSIAYAQGLLSLRDAHAAMAITTQISLGMVVGAIKMQQAGKFDEVQDWEARRWIAEGVDRSGILGVLTYYNLLSERVTGGKVGLSALAGKGVLSRYHTRNALGAFLGPSFGAGQDLFTLASAISKGEGFSEGDAASLRRLLPYQNLFYVKFLFDQLEKVTLDVAGEREAS